LEPGPAVAAAIVLDERLPTAHEGLVEVRSPQFDGAPGLAAPLVRQDAALILAARRHDLVPGDDDALAAPVGIDVGQLGRWLLASPVDQGLARGDGGHNS